ncbi:GNAT family N-acetyltransferase [bacterium]|nr:GNAT family N-acetyltransferase [bacterium]
MQPRRAEAPFDWAALHALILRAFAGMEGRIDPPSSARNLTPESLAAEAARAEIWVLGAPPLACMILTPKPGRLYLGKLAVDPSAQGVGLGATLVRWAETRARALGLPRLELETRVELVENHAFFQHLGFSETGRKAHAGFDRPTSITFGKAL